MNSKDKHKALAWLVWSLAVLFYFYEVFLRISPNAMEADLMRSFQVDAGQLGSLSAFYFYIYSPMQIVVGLLMDRFGSRKLLTLSAWICGLGALLFGLAPTLWVAELGRGLMGLGSAFAFVGLIYICSIWFLPASLALVIGLGNSIGMLGGVAAEAPLSLAVDLFGWRSTMFASGLFGIALGFAILISIRRKKAPQHIVNQRSLSIKEVIIGLKVVCSNINTWINGFIALLFFTSTSAFAGLWGTPFLQARYGISKEEAGLLISLIFVGWVIGGPIIGSFSDHWHKRKAVLKICSLCALLSISPVVYLLLPIWLVATLLLLVGLFSAGQLLNFSLSIEINPSRASGTAAAFTNFLITLGGALLQPLIGVLLDFNWRGGVANGVRVYSISDYQFALTLFPLSFAVAFVLLFFLKERRTSIDT